MSKILVVDDERMIGELLQTVLSRHRHEVVTATNGEQALELFRAHRPGITLLDLHMPGMNGLETLAAIRAIDPAAQVIMLTGVGTDALESRARELGVTDFLRKGLSLDVLVRAVEKLNARPSPHPVVAHPPSEAGPGKPEGTLILVVDDEPHICDLIDKFLTKRSYQVHTACTGLNALAKIKHNPPRLVLLDINMPGMNGVEVLRQMRANHYAGGVIVMTASQDEPLLQQALDLGSVDVMGKPLDLERLLLVVEAGLVLTEP
jgi:DNA-binding response OmpR family regulator